MFITIEITGREIIEIAGPFTINNVFNKDGLLMKLMKIGDLFLGHQELIGVLSSIGKDQADGSLRKYEVKSKVSKVRWVWTPMIPGTNGEKSFSFGFKCFRTESFISLLSFILSNEDLTKTQRTKLHELKEFCEKPCRVLSGHGFS